MSDAQTIASRMSDCAGRKDEKERLACYDRVSAGTQPAPVTSLDTWSGNGLKTTRPFSMDGPWEFSWDTKGGLFQAMMFEKGQLPGTHMPQMLANQTAAGRGASYVPAGGSFYIIMNAIGPWTAKAAKVDE